MARMMPAYCPDGAPPGERELYAELAKSPDTADWIILHSLAIADHVKQVEGEADFAVILPERGVLVIEVKSHQRCKSSTTVAGSWATTPQLPAARSSKRRKRRTVSGGTSSGG